MKQHATLRLPCVLGFTFFLSETLAETLQGFASSFVKSTACSFKLPPKTTQPFADITAIQLNKDICKPMQTKTFAIQSVALPFLLALFPMTSLSFPITSLSHTALRKQLLEQAVSRCGFLEVTESSKKNPGKRPQTVCVSVHLREEKVYSHDICSKISV